MLASLTTTISDLLFSMDESLLSGLSERLMSFLTNNQNDHEEVCVTHDELASHFGVARESVSRELSKLREKGLIKTGRNVIKILG